MPRAADAPSLRRASAWLAVALVGALVFGGLAGSIEDATREGEVEGLVAADQAIQDWLTLHAPRWMVTMGVVLAGAGGAVPMVALMGLVALVLGSRGERFEAATLLFTAFALEGAVVLAKWAFARPRPDGGVLLATGYSYPSGHAAFGALLACLAVWLVLRHVEGRGVAGALSLLAVTWAVLMAASRLLVNVHFLTDVLGGLGLGLAFGGAAFALPDLVALRQAARARASTRGP